LLQTTRTTEANRDLSGQLESLEKRLSALEKLLANLDKKLK
jgi:hypothetical protein